MANEAPTSLTPSSEPVTPASRLAGSPRRWAEAAGFVGIWMALGWALALDANAYLLLGVPLTALFQLGVGRQPIRALWVREAPRFHLGWKGVLLALGLALWPAGIAAISFMSRDWLIGVYAVSAVVGAFAAAYALVQFRRATWWSLAGCLGWAAGLGTAYMLAIAWLGQGQIAPQLGLLAPTLLMLFPVCFLLEEVSFRGALDAHVFQVGGSARVASALFVSCLWGLWHLPLFPRVGMTEIGLVLFAHTLIGVPLALFWRQSGNLAVPAFAHAWIDAVRDSLSAGASG